MDEIQEEIMRRRFMSVPESAFPHTVEGPTSEKTFHFGMTLRDYFAGQALAGMAAHYRREDGDYKNGMHPDLLARDAYRVADSMMETRK